MENPHVIQNLLYPQTNEVNVTAHWNPQDFRFYATDYDRTMFSVFSIAQGMFPFGTGPASDISVTGRFHPPIDFSNVTGQINALPSFMQPIPIHTLTSTNDVWMAAYNKCPTIDLKNEENQQSQTYLNLVKTYKPLLVDIANLTGIPIDTSALKTNTDIANTFHFLASSVMQKKDKVVPFYKLLHEHAFEPIVGGTYPSFKKPLDFSNFYQVFDLLNVQLSHNKLNIDGISKNWESIENLANSLTYQQFSRKVQGTLGGGLLVKKMIVEMDKMASYLTGTKINDDNNVSYGSDPDESTFLPYKYIHYSAHDVTILSLMAATKLSDDYTILQSIPPYGAQIIFELHQSDSVPQGQKPTLDDFYIRIRYNRGFSDGNFTEYQLMTLGGTGCQGGKDANFNCSLSSFKTISYADAIPQNWCSECKNTKADLCLKVLYEEKRSENTTLLIIVPLLGGLLLLLFALVAVVCLRSSKLSRYVRGSSTPSTEPINTSSSVYHTLQ